MNNRGHVLLIDNYDSFTFNLEHYLLVCGVSVKTVRCDQLDLASIRNGEYQGVVVSPGPGRPETAGKLMESLNCLSEIPQIPVLGVCLGMQAMGMFLDFQLIKAPMPMHGKQSRIAHTSQGVFEGLPNPLLVMRYHSLILSKLDTEKVAISAWTIGDELPMGMICKNLPWEGVQFHPESIGTPDGMKMIENWVNSHIS
jgi:para-aminobenzoate synthetase component II